MTARGGWAGEVIVGVRLSVLFCTRLPIRHSAGTDARDLARASWAFPLAGALVGGAAAAVYAGASAIRLPSTVAAALAVAATLLITGCLHEDGLADTADGFGGGSGSTRKLEIMRDSHLGAYGACAVVMSLLLRWAALAAMASPVAVASALVAAHAAARAALPAFMRFVPPARSDGLSAHAGQPPLRSAAIAVLLGALTLVVALGPFAAAIAFVLTASAGVFMAWLSARQIGGQTGDVLGALEQIVEFLILLTAVAMRESRL